MKLVSSLLMADKPSQMLRSSEIKDPAALFERYNIDDIRGIEHKVRGEIEQKKEELRQMVGERYRDLIDAADTIRAMRQSSDAVLGSIQQLQRYCQQLQQTRAAADVSSLQWQDKFCAVASQIKLLLEIPEHIWSALEASQYLQATQLYLLCCHLHGLLQLEFSTGGLCSPVLGHFPILFRHLATIGHFRTSILLESKSLLQGRAVSDQAIAEALVSSMLLEDSSPRQALAGFLLARKSSIHKLLNQPQHGTGIKAQVCNLVELLVTTLFQAYAVFYMPPEGGSRAVESLSCGMLFSTLDNVTSIASSGKGRLLQTDLRKDSWFKHLPSSVTDFQPALRTLAQPIQREQLQETLWQWIENCKDDICHGVGCLLVYVKTVKGLAAIRDAVWNLLSTESISRHWGTVCQMLLEKPLRVWDDFLQQLFLKRLQVITKEESEATALNSVDLLRSALRDLESQTPAGTGNGSGPAPQYEIDVASFLWSECPGDLLSDAGWVSVSQRTQHERSGLAMKTQGLTPRIQSFCSAVDAKLQDRLDDLQHYLPNQSSESAFLSSRVPSSLDEDSTASLFDRFTDSAAVEEALCQGSLACIHHILAYIDSELSASSPSPVPACLSSVLFVARLCQSISELCPNLKNCILGKPKGVELLPKGMSRQGGKLQRLKAVTEVSPAKTKWISLKKQLLKTSMVAYRIWSASLSKVLSDRFGSSLHDECAGAILTTTTNWEDLEIQEESELGNKVTSKIRLPVQSSWFLQSLLFQLCLEVNRVGCHTLPPPTVQDLLQQCLSQVLDHYHSLTLQQHTKEAAFPMTQNRALQLLFDIRYICKVLGPRHVEGKNPLSHDHRIQEVCDWLESFIDPFDLDVFTPPLHANLTRLLQRTSVLLGLMTGSEKQIVPRSASVNSQEPSNILPLASSQFRFGLLPMSSSHMRRCKTATKSHGTSHQTILPPPMTSEDNFGPGSLFRQMAHQAAEPATPALFKLDWLSGVTR